MVGLHLLLFFGILYTVVTIPYSVLTASITSDYAARANCRRGVWRVPLLVVLRLGAPNLLLIYSLIPLMAFRR